jgi:hypothetical protein
MRGRVARNYDPRSVRRGLDAQASMCVEALFRTRIGSAVLWPSRTCSSATAILKAAVSGSDTRGSGPGKELEILLCSSQECGEARKAPSSCSLTSAKPADQPGHLSVRGSYLDRSDLWFGGSYVRRFCEGHRAIGRTLQRRTRAISGWTRSLSKAYP